MAYLLLALAQGIGLLLIPFGLPGLWVQVGALVLYAWFTGFVAVGATSILIVFALALAAEIGEFVLGARYARRYGGGRRAEWGAILGGIAGAFLGLPIPLVGSVVGAFVGAFAGATLLELTTRRGTAPALWAGWGAFLGRVVATAMKGAVSVVIAVVALVSALY